MTLPASCRRVVAYDRSQPVLTGLPLLALAFATILGTIVVILRVDRAGAVGRSMWHRLGLILTAWMWYGNMEVARLDRCYAGRGLSVKSGDVVVPGGW